MRLPTLAGLTAAVRAVFARFPEVMLAGVVAAAMAMGTVHGEGESLGAVWAAAGLAIPLFFVVAMLSEGLHPERVARFGALRLVLDLLVVAAVVAFALAWPHWNESTRAHRLIQFGLAALLFCSFAPFLARHEANAFWQWNRQLFVRFVIGGIFSAVLFGGLAMALAALKALFGIKIPEKAFFDLWLAVVFVFQPAYVMAGIPRDFAALAEDREYPLVLKVFAQFLLVPLVALYLLILSAYLVKVLVTGQWPNGWIGWLVSSVSAAGLLAILLVHPVREREENRWIGTFARGFYVLLLPSLGMLFAAIGKRVGQYGVTEERYDLFALATWMALVALGYSFRRLADIRWIPITLCAVAVLTSFGPWGTYAVSRMDQARRLARTLERIGVTAAGRLTQPRELSFEDRKQLSESVRYLVGAHGLRALPASLRAAAEADSTWNAGTARSKQSGDGAAQAVLRSMGQAYVSKWDGSGTASFSLRISDSPVRVLELGGYERLVRLDGFSTYRSGEPGGAVTARFDSRTRVLTVSDSTGGHWAFALDSLIRSRLGVVETFAQPIGGAPAPNEIASGDGTARLVVRGMQGVVQSDTTVLHGLDADVLLPKR